MIKSEKGKIQLNGDIITLTTELTYILCAFRDTLKDGYSFIKPDEFLTDIVRVSGMTNDELKKENEILRRKLEESEESGCAFDEVPAELTKREKDVLKKLFGINDGGWND